MKSLEELRELRAKLEKEMSARNSEGKPNIIIGMGTCGIAAGARDVLQAVLKELRKRNLDVITSQTGCIGMCEQEPLLDVELLVRAKDNLRKGDSPQAVERIIVEHVINGRVVKDFMRLHAFFEERGV